MLFEQYDIITVLADTAEELFDVLRVKPGVTKAGIGFEKLVGYDILLVEWVFNVDYAFTLAVPVTVRILGHRCLIDGVEGFLEYVDGLDLVDGEVGRSENTAFRKGYQTVCWGLPINREGFPGRWRGREFKLPFGDYVVLSVDVGGDSFELYFDEAGTEVVEVKGEYCLGAVGGKVDCGS